MKVLVTGGVRSGKSRHAERLLAERADVLYVATGPVHDDPDWARRIAAHQARRPTGWTTAETGDAAQAIARADGPVLVDCLGTWLTRLMDERRLWEAPVDEAAQAVEGEVETLAAAVAAAPVDLVLVTNEVGLGVVPEHRSGRLFRDLLGLANQRVGAAVEEVHLLVAGRMLRL